MSKFLHGLFGRDEMFIGFGVFGAAAMHNAQDGNVGAAILQFTIATIFYIVGSNMNRSQQGPRQ